MKKMRIYLDTSIISAYFDYRKPVRQLITQKWFQNDIKNFESFISSLVIQEINNNKDIENITAHSLVQEGKVVHWPNIYTLEEELNSEINSAQKDFDAVSEQIASAESYLVEDAEYLIMAHGIVGAVAKMAVDELREQNIKACLFRPITLRPFPKKQLDKLFMKSGVKKIIVVESSSGQLARVVRDQLAPEIDVSFEYLQKPGLGIEVEEIVEAVSNKL